MTNQPPLFHELEFTKENVLAWAEERVLDCPVVRVDGQDIAYTIQLVLQSVLIDHYAREWSDLDKVDLINELLTYVTKGVDKPIETMDAEQLADEIMEVCKEAYEFQTMDDFVRSFASDVDSFERG
jgi:hypothetical protein